MVTPPPNAYAPGTKLTVGLHKVAITKYISAGGFAHVYTCTIDPPFQGSLVACLKRVVVPNKWQLNLLRQEVDAMKRLRGNKHIVSYIDSHALRLDAPVSSDSPQQYEVFMLMEYCLRNGLIDFMNSRLQHRLTEPEILRIMYEITIGVTMCHNLQPPLIHRDIKIENVLIDEHGTFKLCDFGSAVAYAPVPASQLEYQALHDDIMQHTTPQYRSPEMIDLSKGFPIDDKSDVWALGCFLYKLCYYTTPFELPSQTSMQDLEMAILNCAMVFPHDRPGVSFSPRLKNIIKCCLRPDPRRRPLGIQVLEEVAAMRGVAVPNVIPHTVKTLPPKLPSLPRRKTSGDDPFAGIEKTKTLQQRSGRINTSLIASYLATPKPRPLSYAENSPNLKNFIRKQLNESSEDLRYDETPSSTLDFLRSKEEENGSASRQNTGGSFKSFKHGLRKISTGGLVSANNTGGSIKNKRSSISSIKQLLTGSRRSPETDEPVRKTSGKLGSRRTSPEADELEKDNSSRKISEGSTRKTSDTTRRVSENGKRAISASRKASAPRKEASEEPSQTPVRKLSIQRRMAMLMNPKEEPKRTATGYGRFTNEVDDLKAINHATTPEPEAKPASKHLKSSGVINVPLVKDKEVLKASASSANLTRPRPKSYIPPSVPLSLSSKRDKKPPPKPKKPGYLKSPARAEVTRRLSNSSEISLPDLDDLEQQFSKRFPSYV